jgi:ABC-type Fe3+-siderophore transport system permease subunit
VSTSAPPEPARSLAPGVAVVWLASAAVLAAAVLASFRLGFADDLATLWRVNGPRVLFAAAAGAAFSLSGALRLAAGSARPLGELELFALASGAAGGGFLLASGRSGAAALAGFAAGALAGGALFLVAARALARPARWTNLGAAALLAAGIGSASLAGSYARARRDAVAPAIAWLLGDLSGASFASGLALLALVAALLVASLRALGAGTRSLPGALDLRSRLGVLGLVAFGVGAGAAGLLPFVGTFAPRAVAALAPLASQRARLAASAVAGGAAVAAIDAVPRLLVGGYDFPFAVPAAMLAVPIFLGWNRLRLRREVGAAGRAFEALELALLALMTLAGAWLAVLLSGVIRVAT